MPKGFDITGENLEDLLAYDDLFLDYFNHFLALSVFPQALVYNRLTGAFDEVECLYTDLRDTLPAISPSLQYGPTDVERERMLEWAREERLPLFLRTQLFRELKLIKLLLRPLEFDWQSASRGSIRGYSRSTESYISSLSLSGDNSGPDIHDYDDIWEELNYSALYRHQRPGSRALSLPTKVLFDTQSYGLPSTIGSAITQSSERSTIQAVSPNISKRFDVSSVQFTKLPEIPPVYKAAHTELHAMRQFSGKVTETARQKARISNKVEVIPPVSGTAVKSMRLKSNSSFKCKATPSTTEEAFLCGARVLSAPVNYEQFLKMPHLDLHDFETLFGEPEPDINGHPYVQFGDEAVSEEQTETDMRNLESKLRMTIQQVKENMLGTRGGFESFREFLRGTMGEDLLAFWLDCENYKDTMEDFDDIEIMEIRNQHFRDIQDKYKLKLTTDARDQIMKAASIMGLSHTIFLRTQYDVLRRLRAYWIARFLIHCERMDVLSLDCEDSDTTMEANAAMVQLTRAVTDTAKIKQSRPENTLFPCISLVHSMPLLPEDARDYANNLLMNVTFENTNSSARRMFPQQRSTLSAMSRSLISNKIQRPLTTFRSMTKERFVLALTSDRLAGGPFKRYLARLDDPSLLASLLFWEDVTEFGSTEDHSSDRLLRLQHAWNIYNKYLSEDSLHRINLPEKETKCLQHHLEKARHFMEVSIFDNSKIQAVEKLEKAWIRYLKEDLKCFLDCRVIPGGESPPSTAEAIEITVTEYDVVIKRPRPWVRRVLGSSSTIRVADDIDDETKAQRKTHALARRKRMERERKKAVRAAYARQRDARKRKSSIGSSKDDELHGRGERSDKLPTYADMFANKLIMSMFRQYVTEDESKEILNSIHLYNEVENYFSSKDSEPKKDSQAAYIAKMYLDPHGKKHIPLNDSVIIQLAQEKDRPRTAVLREIQTSILPKVEEIFKDFITKQAEAFHMDPRDLPMMSQSEFAMRVGIDQSIMSGWNKRKSRGKGQHVVIKTTGRAQATRDDKNEFLSALSQSAIGHPSIQMLYFYKYLLKHSEEDDMPLIDKDLFFYIEVQKFKDGSHAFSDDELLKGKVQSIVECFLDSVYTPTLQIDIPSDMHLRTLKASQRYLNGKETLPILFDSAQFQVFKELLFYWAGYKHVTGTPEDMNTRPVTKYDKMLQRRMENIVNYQVPTGDFILPSIPEGAVPSFSISLSEGVKFKETDDSFNGTPVHEGGINKERRGSKVTLTDVELGKRSRGRSGSNSVLAR